MNSAIQPRLIEGPGGGIIRHLDPRHIPDQAWARGRNVRFPTGGSRVRTTDGYNLLDTLPAGIPMALWWYTSTEPTEAPRLIRITTIQGWTGVGGIKGQIGGWGPYDLTDVVTIDQYKDQLIWANGKTVQVYDGLTPFVPLENAPICALVEVHKDRILLARSAEQPWRVNFSAPGDPEDWGQPVTGTDEAGYLDFHEDPTPVMAIKVLGDHVIIHKPNRLVRMINIGGETPYIQEGIPADEGAISARAPISVGSYQYFPGRTNIYRLGTYTEPIGDAIWPEIAEAIDWPRAILTYAYRRLEYDEICWKFPTRSASQPNVTVAFNIRAQTWTVTDHDPANCFTEVPSDALPGTIFDDEHSPVSPAAVRGIFANVAGELFVYGGENAATFPIHAWVEGKYFTEQLTPVKILAVPVVATGHGILQVSARAAMDPRQPLPAWDAPQPLALDPAQYRPWVDTRKYGRLWQIRLESNARDTHWSVEAYGSAVIPGNYAR